MKRNFGGFLVSVFFLAAFSPAVFADNSPSRYVVIPEAIWSPATGGGTWVTSLQVTAKTAGTQIDVQFFYGNGWRTVTNLVTTTNAFETHVWTNILQTMGDRDTGFDYSGRVGSLLIYTPSDAQRLWATAMTTNGNYGKTYPSFVYGNNRNSAHIGRQMVIPGARLSSTYRTFIGLWNGTPTSKDVKIEVICTSSSTPLGEVFKYLPAYNFGSFNPFEEAGVTGDRNTWIRILVVGSGGGDGLGVFCFGSIANNITNDTYALIAIPFTNSDY